MAEILIIDDEDFIRESLGKRIERIGHNVTTASSLEEAKKIIEKENIDLVFLDVNLPDGSGLDALSTIRKQTNDPEVIIITGAGNKEGASEAIKKGAWDYITKPFNKDVITLLVKRTIEFRKSRQKHIEPVALETGSIIGKSVNLKKAINQIATCASNRANVLILGETGTGKELFAKAIHDNDISPANGDYIVVDCAAMPDSLTESILFGHEKGAFTGADKASEGLIKKADKGTLFLDEIGELPMSVQKSFLRVLQERKFRPVGSSNEISSDFRLISATNRDLDKMVSEGKFREDLLHRIKTISIDLPPLRERKGDIQVLTQYYITRICKKHSLRIKALIPDTLEVLEAYDWPGNIRELINSIEKSILSEPMLPILYPMFLPDRIRINFADKRINKTDNSSTEDNSATYSSVLKSLYDVNTLPQLKEFREAAIEESENLYLRIILKQTDWDIEKAANISGISKSRVYFLLKKYNIKK